MRTVAFDERPLLDLAREHSVGLFSKDCERARHAYDAAAVLDEHVAAAERNRCDFIPCEGGFLAIRGFFDPIAAAPSRPPPSLSRSRRGLVVTARRLAASPTRW